MFFATTSHWFSAPSRNGQKGCLQTIPEDRPLFLKCYQKTSTRRLKSQEASFSEARKSMHHTRGTSLDTETKVSTLIQPNSREKTHCILARNLINSKRRRQKLDLLKRSYFLDSLAAFQARHMAKIGAIRHLFNDTEGLESCLRSNLVGENVIDCGCSTVQFRSALKALRSRQENSSSLSQSSIGGANVYENMLKKEYTQFGCSVAKGTNGRLYMCQLFRV